jgi:hypothetical protein
VGDAIFSSLLRSGGDFAGVFEYDGETGYFYLYRTNSPDGAKIVDAIPVVSGVVDLAQSDVTIQWNRTGTKVALFLRNVMWAVFDCVSGDKFGGDYGTGKTPRIPASFTFDR